MIQKVKSWGRRLAAVVSVAAVSCMAAVSAFASEPSDPYASITTELGNQSTKLFASAQTMVLSTIGAGLVIFGIFLLFKLGKRAIAAATSSRG